MRKNIIRKYLLITGGTISFSIGIVGIMIPLLPTTPFLLLSSYCYIKSSRKLYDFITTHKIFGKYISNYIEHKGIDKKSMIISIAFLWLTLGVSIILLRHNHLRGLLVLVGIFVSIHILKLKRI